MHVTQLEWIITLGVTIAVLLFDVVVVARRPHEPTTRECMLYLTIYLALAVFFGLWVWLFHGGQYGLEFFAGWLTEYSLSVDNLFVFLIVMASFSVPKIYQQQALLVGIILALVFRGIFIALGAVAINEFSWVFYIFGAFLSTPRSTWPETPTTTTMPRTSPCDSRDVTSNSLTSGTASSSISAITASGR